jgi:hypothetical protein
MIYHFSGDGHGDDLTQAGIVESEEPRNLARCHIAAAFRHHANTSLRIGCLKRVDVMDKRRFRSNFKVPDHRITLSS